MTHDEIKDLDSNYIMNTYSRFDVALQKGDGATVYDVSGKRYIDFSAGIAVNSLGFASKQWAEAIAKQAATLQHMSNLYYSPVTAQLAKELCTSTGYDKVFFCNSGAEANECAIKLARKYSATKYGENRYNIITINNSFHGRTMATLSATAQPAMHKYFDPFLTGFIYSAPDESILDIPLDTVCAIMIETIQGESGVKPLSSSFIELVAKICLDNDIIFITDEIQTGIGRTGTLLAMEHYGIKADVVTLAKGLGGGLPIGACLATEKYANVLQKADHGSTFGGNPVVCAGALVVLEQINNKIFLDNIKNKFAFISQQLSKAKHVKQVRGRGLMIGLELDIAVKAREVAEICLQNGLICLTAHEALRLVPPLNITDAELNDGLTILKEVLGSI